MQSVRMHVDGSGVLWALTKCRMCGEIHKYLATEVVQGEAICRSCRHRMSVDGAVFEAPGQDDIGAARKEEVAPVMAAAIKAG